MLLLVKECTEKVMMGEGGIKLKRRESEVLRKEVHNTCNGGIAKVSLSILNINF